MTESVTLQDLLVRFLEPEGLDAQQQRVCAHLIDCRTEALGRLERRCDRCGAEQPRYRSCGRKNRTAIFYADPGHARGDPP